RISMRIEQLRLGRLTEPPAEPWTHCAGEPGRAWGVDGLAKPAEVPLDGGRGHEHGAELQSPAAICTVLDLDLEDDPHQKLTPGAIARAIRRRGLALRSIAGTSRAPSRRRHGTSHRAACRRRRGEP